jgi:hypothetical protein
VSGNLTDYTLHLAIDNVIADISLHGTTPAWRPKTGYIIARNALGIENNYVWLVAVPAGTVTATLNIGGTIQNLTGVGYHDHDWGNINISNLYHHWYWGRAKLGSYDVDTSYLVSTSTYNYSKIPLFLLTKNGAKVVDDNSKVTFTMSNIVTDPTTDKPVANDTAYEYNDGTNHYLISFHRVSTIMSKMEGTIAYHRFMGTVTLQRDTAAVRSWRRSPTTLPSGNSCGLPLITTYQFRYVANDLWLLLFGIGVSTINILIQNSKRTFFLSDQLLDPNEYPENKRYVD